MPRVRISNAGKKFANDGIDFAIDFDGVFEAAAAGHLADDAMHNQPYLDAIVDEAFEKADDVFNMAAAAMGASGSIKHMYEWGTIGINTGQSNFKMTADKPAARLWQNFTEGKGLNRTLWFAYKPSVANVPKPTQGATGMSAKAISELNTHVFRWKAEVMEEGQKVTVQRKGKTKFLLIPAYKENRPNMSKADIKRGYSLLKRETHPVPGKSVQNNFREYWAGFWNEEGDTIISEHVFNQFLTDYRPETLSRRTSKTLRPVGSVNISAEVAKRRKVKMNRMMKRAKKRRMSK